jgi:sugar phosphate isomerase/epimerase
MMLRYAICNETFTGWDHARVCDFVAATGYTGLEIAPFTLAPRITDVSADQRRELRRVAEAAGLQIIGLHYLLAKTEGFHVTSADPAVRRATGIYIGELARACRDLGGELLVFGSPIQRKIPPGVSHQQAEDYAVETFSFVLPVLDETGLRLGLEPLAPAETDFLNTCAQGLALADRLNHPRVSLHMDVKAMASEPTPTPELIRRHIHRTIHFHANDASGRGPGMGNTDFRPILSALQDANYAGWVSVEVFDYKPDPETIARESLRYLRRVGEPRALAT